MARTLSTIQNEIIAQVQSSATLAPLLTSTSKTAIWREITFVVAVAIYTLEKLLDVFKQDVDTSIAELKPHSLRWYANKSKAFQYGFALVTEADYYDNTGVDELTIEASKIIAYAAVVEQQRGLRIKVAKDNGTDLEPLTITELNAFKDYMKEVKDAGVKLEITSTVADQLKLQMDIYYNPQILNSLGGRLDGTVAEPVQDAIKNYLKNLPFNGVFLLQNLIDELQKVEGVVIAHLINAEAQYGLLSFSAFAVQYVPDSGYLRIENNNLILNFISYSE